MWYVQIERTGPTYGCRTGPTDRDGGCGPFQSFTNPVSVPYTQGSIQSRLCFSSAFPIVIKQGQPHASESSARLLCAFARPVCSLWTPRATRPHYVPRSQALRAVHTDRHPLPWKGVRCCFHLTPFHSFSHHLGWCVECVRGLGCTCQATR
jgi:hypothetical protein